MADGTVKWFNATKAFGLIVPDDPIHDGLVRFPPSEGTGDGELNEGQRVEFDSGSGQNGSWATRVRPLVPEQRDRSTADAEGIERPMTTDANRDEQALMLRDQGQSFGGIAQALGLDGARAANAAFNRALRQRPVTQQAWLRSRESVRLDAVASRVRGRDDLSVEEVVRRLRGVKQQRKTLFVA